MPTGSWVNGTAPSSPAGHQMRARPKVWKTLTKTRALDAAPGDFAGFERRKPVKPYRARLQARDAACRSRIWRRGEIGKPLAKVCPFLAYRQKYHVSHVLAIASFCAGRRSHALRASRNAQGRPEI